MASSLLDQLEPEEVQAPPPSTTSLADELEPETTEQDDAYLDTLNVNPDHAAKVRRLADKHNEEMSFVDKNLDRVEKMDAAPPSEFWKQLEASNPNAAKWFKDRRNMAVAKDDIGPFAAIANYASDIGSGWELGNLRARMSELQAERLSETRKTGQYSLKNQQLIDELNAKIAPLSEREAKKNGDTTILYEAASQLPNMSRAFFKGGAGGDFEFGPASKRAIEGAGAGIVGGGTVGSVVPGLGTAVGATGGATLGAELGATAGLAEYAYTVEAGSAFEEYSNLKDINGNRINPKAAANAAHTVGLINAGLETASELVLLKAGKLVSGAIAPAAIKAISKIPGGGKIAEIIGANPKAFVGMTLGKAIKQAGKALALAEASEISTEFVQEAVTGVGKVSAIEASGQGFNDNDIGSLGQTLKDATGVIPKTAKSTLVFGALGGAKHIHDSVKEMKKASTDKETFLKTAELAAAAQKVKERSPEAHEDFIENATQGTPIQTVFIKPETLETYFQDKKLDEGQSLKELGIEKEFKAAKEEGRKVEIPVSTLVSRLDGTPHIKGLSDHISFAPEGLSATEQKDREAVVGKQLEDTYAKVEKEVQADEQKKTVFNKIVSEVTKDRLASPPKEMTPKEDRKFKQEVEKSAKLWAARSFVAAKRDSFAEGKEVTPEEWFQKNRPRVVAGGEVQAGALNQSAMAPAFYSKLTKTVEEKMGGSASVEQINGMLKEIKPEERKWSGLDEFLKGKEKVSKEELLAHLQGNQLQIEEVTKGKSLAPGVELESVGESFVYMKDGVPVDPFTGQEVAKIRYFDTENEAEEFTGTTKGAVKFSQYTLPGGENYREVLFTLPPSQEGKVKLIGPNSTRDFDTRAEAEDALARYPEDVAALSRIEPGTAEGYRSSHFGEPNVLAHTRLNDRVDADGKRVLFVEEIQSDWHQEGRKKGYKGDNKTEAKYWLTKDGKRQVSYDNEETAKKDLAFFQKSKNAANVNATFAIEQEQAQVSDHGSVPDAPFRKTWHEFVLKRLIREAAEKGYDKIAWTTGEQQADRYDLSKQIDKIEYLKQKDGNYWLQVFDKNGKNFYNQRDLSPTEMEEVVGKDLTSKITTDNADPAIEYEKRYRISKEGTDAFDLVFKSKSQAQADLKMMEMNEGGKWTITEERGPIKKESAFKSLEGLDLKVGGEGMKGFYDKIIVDAANKLGKKYGAKVEDDKIGVGSSGRVYDGPKLDSKELINLAKTADARVSMQLLELSHALNGPAAADIDFLEYNILAGQKLSDAAAEHVGGKLVDGPENSETVHSLPITPQLKAAALNEGFPLFQRDENIQGQVLFNGEENPVVKLFKSANESTFIHESAHIWLQDTFQFAKKNSDIAPESFKQDYRTLADWLGVKEDQTKLTTEQHEKFARGFETYLKEGKSPSLALKSVFAAFKRWMKAIYKAAGGTGVDISDEVRGVMDRMIATEEEIQAAQEASGLSESILPYVKDLDPKQAMRLETLAKQAREKAESALLKPQMEEIKKDRKKLMAERQAQVEKSVTDRLSAEPVYQAEHALKVGLGSNKTAKHLAKQFIDGKLKEDKKAIVEAQADLLGYSSGDEMAKTIVSAPTLQDAIREQVKAEMSAFADLKDTAVIREMALKAIHNSKQFELASLEHEILASLVDGKEISDEIKARKSSEAKTDSAEIKAKAARILANRNIKTATAYRPFFTAARQAAEGSVRALSKKDYEKASQLKREQMLNQALAQESIRIEKRAKSWAKTLLKLKRLPMEKFNKEEHFFQVAELLRKLGVNRSDYDPSKKTETLSQWTDRMNEETNIVNIPGWLLDESKLKDLRSVTVSEFSDTIDALKNIMSVASFEKRAMKLWNGATFNEIKAGLIADQSDKVRAPTPKMEEGALEAISQLTAKYTLSLVKAQTLLKKIQGYKDFGSWIKTFWEPVYNAANDESRLMERANKDLDKSFQIYNDKERREIIEKKIYQPELGTSVSKIKLLMMALNVGNADNRQKLSNTRPVGVSENLEWNENVVMQMLQRELSVKDWQFVENTWNLLNSFWPQVAELHKRVTGFTPGKVEATPFNVVTKDGVVIPMKGGYFPLREDKRSSFKAFQQDVSELPLYTEKNPAWVATTKTGHTKTRTNAQYAVALDHNIIYQHLRDVIHDIAFRETVIDLRRLISDKDVQAMLKQSVGIEGHAMLKEWIGSVATGNTSDAYGAFEQIVGELRRRSTVAALAFRASVILQNFSNPFLFGGAIEGFENKDAMRAMMTRGVTYAVSAISNREKYHEVRNFVFSKSAFMRDKDINPDYSFYETKAKAFGEDSKILEFGKALMAGSDELTSIPMWQEAYSMALDRGMEESDAIQYADRLVENTLGSGRKYDTSKVQRSNEFIKAIAMFYSFLNTEYNRWANEFGGAKVDPKKIPRLLGFVASRMIIFNTVSMLFSGKGPEDDEDWLKFWLKETMSYPTAFFPGFRDFAKIAMEELFGFKSFGYRPSPATSAIESALKSVKVAVQTFDGDAEGQQLLESLSKTASYIAPYPDQFNAWFWNAYDASVNNMSVEPKDIYKRRASSDR